MWNFSFNELTEYEYHSEATETQNDKIQNKKRSATKYSTKHNLQRKRQKPVEYRDNSLDDFRLMIIYPHQKLESDELELLSKCYGQETKKELNEDISKRVLNNLLKRWDQNRTQSHPSYTAITSAEHISLRFVALF